MANTYYKILNNQMASDFINSVLNGVQRDLHFSAAKSQENLYDVAEQLRESGVQLNNLDINMLLKYYVINQILQDTPQSTTQKEKRYKKTANSKIVFDSEENCYCKVEKNGKYAEDKTIKNVDEDGSYTKIRKIVNSSYKTKNYYNAEHKLIGIQLLDSNENVVANKYYVAEILGMKKEYVQKFKYAGYSGNSVDILAAIGNKICSPIESGYFMDSHFNLYRWSESKKCFLKNQQDNLSPLLTDYQFENGKKVIRKEYIGA